MINRSVSLFYRYPLKAFHHMVCPCTLDGVYVVCPGTSELVGQQDAVSLLCYFGFEQENWKRYSLSTNFYY